VPAIFAKHGDSMRCPMSSEGVAATHPN